MNLILNLPMNKIELIKKNLLLAYLTYFSQNS